MLLVVFEKMDLPLLQKEKNKEVLPLYLYIGNAFASNVGIESPQKDILQNKKQKWQVEKTNKCKKNSQILKTDYSLTMYFIYSY